MLLHVLVMPRKDLLDPQGKAIAEALHTAGFDAGSSVRSGRCFAVDLPSEEDPERARAAAAEMAVTLLCNPVTEDFMVVLPGEALP
jgi:phosphoribosylformylglycinamidine synthase subunit PurS